MNKPSNPVYMSILEAFDDYCDCVSLLNRFERDNPLLADRVRAVLAESERLRNQQAESERQDMARYYGAHRWKYEHQGPIVEWPNRDVPRSGELHLRIAHGNCRDDEAAVRSLLRRKLDVTRLPRKTVVSPAGIVSHARS